MKILVSNLTPGMVLAQNVYGPEGKRLLHGGVTLTAKYIYFLKKYNILAVNIQSTLDDMLPQDGNILEDEVKLCAVGAIRQWTSARVKTSQQYSAMVDSVEDIADEILSGKLPLSNLSEISSFDTYTFTHSVDVCALSVYCGMKLNYPRKRLILLGIGSLLHDLGKLKVDPIILNKPDQLTSEEFSQIKNHPAWGYSMLRKEININVDARAAIILLNHHERYDGTGYPRGLKGAEIDEMSAICSIADVYNAMVTDRIYRKALSQNEVYEMLLASGNVMFNMDTLKAFLLCINPYPIGSFVKLNSGHIGCVIGLNPDLPLRPILQLIATREIIDLKKELSLVIAANPELHELMALAKKSA
ncbi:MAG: HD-GYP domain-containing protein [Syntrophomonadaceae bacterium]